MKLELKPEIEAGLLAQAHARGLSLEAYLGEVLTGAAATKPRPASRKSPTASAATSCGNG